MKQIYLSFFVFVLCFNNLTAQTSCLPGGITFSTQGQIDSFMTNYPGCMEILGDLTIGGTYNNWSYINNLDSLIQITSIQGELKVNYITGLSNLSGLDNLSEIGTLDIAYTSLTSFIGLENITTIKNNFKVFSYSNTGSTPFSDFTGLNNLNYIGGHFSIYFEDLASMAGLENLDTIGGSLLILEESYIATLEGLGNLKYIGGDLALHTSTMPDFNGMNSLNYIGGNLYITNTGLQSFEGLENLNSIEGDFLLNSSNLINLNGLNGLTSIGGSLRIGFNDFNNPYGSFYPYVYAHNTILINLSGIENLTSIGNTLYINSNDALISLEGLNASLSPASTLSISNNPNLSICNTPSICNYLATPSLNTVYISANDSGCETPYEIIYNCADFAKVNASTFYDVNQNQVQDIGEPFYNNTVLTILPENIVAYSNINDNNMLFFNPGSYTVSYEQLNNPDWTLTTSPASFTLTLGAGEIDTIAFGVYPNQQISDMQAYITSPPTRCNETITFNIDAENYGTTVTSGTLWLEIDENILATNFINTPDTMIAPNLYGWFFSDLYPSYTVEQDVEMTIPGPATFTLGDNLYFNTYVEYTDANGGQSSTAFEYAPTVLCSYDPNDKQVNPDRTNDFLENYTLFGESLIYTIRFQNTGNDVAYHVSIQDELDGNLDRSTFQVIGTSHPDKLTTSMDTDGVLTFDFQYIFLPDSTSNPAGSQGYVTYKIDPVAGLAENTVIDNTAAIYFDANPPIITNTTENVLVSVLPTISITQADAFPDLAIFPNPNTGIFKVTGIDEGSYKILNTTGQVIQHGRIQPDLSIDMSEVASGVYFMHLRVNGQTLARRLVKL